MPAAVITIGPGNSIQHAIDTAHSGDTILLNKGTYRQHDILIRKNIIIRGNTTLGVTAENIIIDAGSSGRIFNNSAGSYTLAVERISLKNGNAGSLDGGAIYVGTGATLSVDSAIFTNCSAENGGAILNKGLITSISRSRFTDCSAADNGGVIDNRGTISSISSTTFSHCSAANSGGSLFSTGTITSISSATFTNCSAALMGGAVANTGPIPSISSATFSDCSAGTAGGAILNAGTITSLSSSTFVRCSSTPGLGYGGGAILNYGTITSLSSSNFSACSAGTGGAFLNYLGGTATISSSRFTGCSATGMGGAVFASHSILSLASVSFTDCSAADKGGALFSEIGPVSVRSSSFTGCSAMYGGALYANTSCGVHFSRFYNNHAVFGPAVYSQSGTTDAIANWWGSNANPSASVSGDVSVSPWLVLGAAAVPSPINTSQTALVRANLTWTSTGSDTTGVGHVWNGTPVIFSVTGGTGSLAPQSGNTTLGTNSTRFTPSAAGTFSITAMIDGQTVSVPVTVLPVAPVANFTAAPRSGLYPLPVRFIDLSSNIPATWKWTFGDNSSVNSTQKNPLHTYASPGTYTVSLQATNAGGSNTTTRTGFITVTAPAPTVTGITPASGKRGLLVSITNLSGTGFRAGAKVFFNKSGSSMVATNVSIASSKKINCTVKIPAGALIGPWNVTVRNTDGKRGTKANAFMVKTPAAPTVTGITPSSGKRGTPVAISDLSGTGFVGTPKPVVQLVRNSAIIRATNVTVVSPQKITCIFPLPGDALTGTWNTRVVNADNQSGVKTGAFTITL